MRFDAEPRPGTVLRPLQLAAPDIEAWLLDKEPQAIGDYLDLAPEEYARAFTAAQTAGTTIADDLDFALIDIIASGGGEQRFADLVMPILREKGWLQRPGDRQSQTTARVANRVALIYDTNLRVARAAGRWTGYQKSKALFPYLRAFTAGDERVRHPPKSPNADHRAWDGIILPVEHPFWRTYWPPLGFRCRCDVVQMSRSQLMRHRGGVTSPEDLEYRIKRLGPPVFLSPVAPIAAQLDEMVEAVNNPPPKPARGWTINGQSGLSPDEANSALEAQRAATAPRTPGLPPVDPRRTEREGRDIWDTVIAARSREDLGRQLARFGF